MRKMIAIAILGCSLQSMTVNAQRSELTNLIYQTVKANEKSFPRPKLLDTIFVGTFHFNDQSFEGITSGDVTPMGPSGKPRQRNMTGLARSKAAGSVLRFSTDQAASDLTVVINNRRYTARNNVYVKVGAQEFIDWTIEQGARKYKDRLHVHRLIIGAGAFTLPYIPVTILYAPPVANADANYCSYMTLHAVGTSLGLSTTNEVSETKPKMTAINIYNKILDNAISSTAGNPDPDVQLVHKILEKIRPAFGDENIQNTVGSVSGDEVTISAGNFNTQTYTSPVPGAGPGHSDKYILLVNARILWFVENGVLSYTLLDFESVMRPTLDQMKSSDDAFLHSLAMMDPFFTGKGTKPQPPRFTPCDVVPVTILQPTDVFDVTIGKEDITSHRILNTSYTTEVKDYTGGYMSFLGLGYDTKTIKQTFTQSSLYEVSNTSAQVSSIHMINATDRPVTVQLFYDNAFGGLVVYEYPEHQLSPVSDGVLRDAGGTPVGHRKIKLQIGTTTYETTTDKNGHYTFLAEKGFGATKGTLINGSDRKEILLSVKGPGKTMLVNSTNR